MNKKFEQLIEYVINDEEDKARALFHDIVVEKSRQIYEEMMDAEEEIDEAREEEEESVEEAREEEEESVEEAREEEEESVEEAMGGDSADDLIDDVSVEEEGISMEADEEEADMDIGDEAGDDIEGKLMNIEDKLDELMAEFEALMGDEDMGDEIGDEEEIDIDMGDDGEDMDMDMDVGDEEPMAMPMGEAISLKAAPKPVTSEEGGINKKSTVAANSGARGMEGKPVKTGQSQGGKHDAPGAYSNQVKDMIGDVQNAPAKSTVSQKPATKPHLAQATGVNTKSPL